MFDERSRYAGIPTVVRVIDGREVSFVGRRLLPEPRAARGERTAVPRITTRADLLADRLVGDSRLYWRVADANGAMNPFDLGRPGVPVFVPES